jgi:hypothetical protein
MYITAKAAGEGFLVQLAKLSTIGVFLHARFFILTHTLPVDAVLHSASAPALEVARKEQLAVGSPHRSGCAFESQLLCAW